MRQLRRGERHDPIRAKRPLSVLFHGVRIPTRGNIHRHHRRFEPFHHLPQQNRKSSQRRLEARSHHCIDQQSSVFKHGCACRQTRLIRSLIHNHIRNFYPKALQSSRGFALDLIDPPQQNYTHRLPGLCQRPRSDKSVTPVVSFPAKYSHWRRRAILPHAERRDRMACVLHQQLQRHAELLHRPSVRRPHLLRCQDLHYSLLRDSAAQAKKHAPPPKRSAPEILNTNAPNYRVAKPAILMPYIWRKRWPSNKSLLVPEDFTRAQPLLLGSTHGAVARDGRLLQKIALVPQCSLKPPRQFGRLGPERWPSTFKKKHRNDPPVRRICVRSKPAKPCSVIRTCSRLPHHRKLTKVGSQRTCGPIVHRTLHSLRNLRNQRCNLQCPLDLRLKLGDLLRSLRVLQIVECSSIRDRRYQCPQLQWSHRHALAKRTHPAHATQRSRQL